MFVGYLGQLESVTESLVKTLKFSAKCPTFLSPCDASCSIRKRHQSPLLGTDRQKHTQMDTQAHTGIDLDIETGTDSQDSVQTGTDSDAYNRKKKGRHRESKAR